VETDPAIEPPGGVLEPGASLRERARALLDEVYIVKWQAEQKLPPLDQLKASDAAILSRRVEYRARRAQWPEAVADHRRLLELETENRGHWCAFAPLLVQSGDLDGYGRHRHAMLGKFKPAADVQAMEQLAKNALLVPTDGEDLEAAAKLADEAVKLGKNHPYLAYFQFAEGLAQYRRGWCAEAIATEASIASNGGVPERAMAACAVIAMAQHRLNHPAEAREALANAAQWASSKLPPLDANHHINWGDFLIAHILLREAQALLGGK
jgi:hypothetical protein